MSTDSEQMTDINFRKNRFFLAQGVSKRKDLMEIPKVIFLIKPISSYVVFVIQSACLMQFSIRGVQKDSIFYLILASVGC